MKVEWKIGTKLTKRMALRICYRLWSWLARYPGRIKEEWPGWSVNEGEVDDMMHRCPCCHITVNNRLGCGTGCLLREYWTSGTCTTEGEYGRWTHSRGQGDSKRTAHYARQIAKFAKTELERLGGKL